MTTLASSTSTALSVEQTLEAWSAAIAAFQPLLAAGMMLASDVIGFFRKMNPGATNDELNAILTALLAGYDKEHAAVAEERAVAQADLAAGR